MKRGSKKKQESAGCRVRTGEDEVVVASKLVAKFSAIRKKKENKVVDGKRKTPHNLVSLLLTNKTI